MRHWKSLEEAAKEECRFDEIEAVWEAATDEITRLYEQAASTAATTFEGLQCKARLYLRDECDQEAYWQYDCQRSTPHEG